IDTTAVVTLNNTDGGFAITDIALQSQIVLPDVSPAAFDEIIQKAKAGCPVSKVLFAFIFLFFMMFSYAFFSSC
ncbi:OsmC family peroxiredoxin, partial [Klebsiella pneumoniae]